MAVNPNVAEIASLLGEPSRATILTSLMDGRFHTASELAYMASVKPQTASFHLAKLVEGNLVIFEKHGRYRYYQLSNQEVAIILESFLSISRPSEVRSFKQSTEAKALYQARTCYDHLAGRLGVDLTDSMVKNDLLEKDNDLFVVTQKGEKFLTDFGLDVAKLRKKRRSFSRACLDWSERHHHLAGALGQGLMTRLFDLGWIARIPSTRAVKITDKGKKGFNKHFQVHMDK
ncbi:helix-turn-helix domain-containing protein [Halobacillus salinarum]|uniref:Helix-turn-helix domain-containing protein n=1 Tax=Halobacillus salinarum TaxID=2932257 RepID=A0ABY4EH01_9BACI|nr:helix-turn-helix domain-containing protein [Halobacillus salinarum]UOQ43749.1 helix-turn-helix domain-containing protein [Halobacillus salinarum]